jgi:hypothetical protein
MMSSSYKRHPRLETRARVARCDWPDCGAACCIYGAWVDKRHAEDILAHAAEISPHMEPEHADPCCWFDGQEEDDDHALSGKVVHTTILPNPEHYGGTSCIFLRKDMRCALQVAAEYTGQHPWRFKPFYCILHPLDLDDEGFITLDDLEVMLREPASCLRPAAEEVQVRELFTEELGYLLGKPRR